MSFYIEYRLAIVTSRLWWKRFCVISAVRSEKNLPFLPWALEHLFWWKPATTAKCLTILRSTCYEEARSSIVERLHEERDRWQAGPKLLQPSQLRWQTYMSEEAILYIYSRASLQWFQLEHHLTATPWDSLRNKCPDESSQPMKFWETTTNCGFKPPRFRVGCFTAIDTRTV